MSTLTRHKDIDIRLHNDEIERFFPCATYEERAGIVKIESMNGAVMICHLDDVKHILMVNTPDDDNLLVTAVKEKYCSDGVIAAIKKHREIMGLGLKETKLKVERLARTYSWQKPDA